MEGNKPDSSLPYCVEWDSHHLVANKNIEPGELILEEDPLVITPLIKDHSSFMCLGCCKKMVGEPDNCPNCKWPMCGNQECWTDGSLHALGECGYLKVAKDLETDDYSDWIPDKVYRSIWILRCLSLKKKEPSKFDKLMKVMEQSLGFSSKKMDDFKDVEKLMNRWFPADAGISKELIKKICSFFSLFSFELVTTSTRNGDKGLMHVVYHLANMMDHCCVPNVTYGYKENGQIVIRASVPITKGSKIYNDYTMGGFSFTMQRQLMLKKTRFGSCSCQRCKDPTELGTFESGVYCFKCPNREGVLLPENPLNRESDWLCNKCFQREPFGRQKGQIDWLLRSAKVDSMLLKPKSVRECEDYISKYESILHPNNAFMTQVKEILVDIYGTTRDGRAMYTLDEMMDKKEALTLELLKILDVVNPGLSRSRGLLINHFFAVVWFRNGALEGKNCEDIQIEEPYSTREMKLHKQIHLP